MTKLESAPAVPREASAVDTTPSAVPGQPELAPTAGARISRLDLVEWLLVLSFYAYFFWNFIPAFLEKPTWPLALVIAAEGATVLVLLVRRRARSFSTSLGDWLLALGTTVLPALIIPAKQSFDPAWVGITLMTAGLCGRILCTIFLGRSFGLVAANRGVQRTGPYRLVRHPIYATYFVYLAGIFWLNPTVWNSFVYMVCWTLLLWRIEAEESHLRQDPAYVAYQQVVRYRLIPGLY